MPRWGCGRTRDAETKWTLAWPARAGSRLRKWMTVSPGDPADRKGSQIPEGSNHQPRKSQHFCFLVVCNLTFWPNARSEFPLPGGFEGGNVGKPLPVQLACEASPRRSRTTTCSRSADARAGSPCFWRTQGFHVLSTHSDESPLKGNTPL